ncbi:hypothetical protein HY478_01450 [Candidatus Uhrbacteria bacterium]|nr:hypothetical protein [Candidatus Uhrbacteria bacterium]
MEEVRAQLGDDVVICLEPEAVRLEKTDPAAKEAAAKAGKGDPEQELWVFDPKTGRSGRGDQKFFDVRVVDRGGWNQLVVFEEPGLADPPEGERRVIGHVIVDVNPRGMVRHRTAKGLNGGMLELKPSSVSKGDLAGGEETPVGYFEANPQRIGGGYIAVYRHEVDFPDEEGMTPVDFRAQSTDGRSLSALAKCGL